MVHVTVETVYETTTTAALGAQRRARGLRRRRLCNTLYVEAVPPEKRRRP